jgi:FeS assembly protein IscX
VNPGESSLTWEDSYAIARALAKAYPEVDLEQVSLLMIYQWTTALPDFDDEPELVNDAILAAIFQEWYEEVTLV